MAFSYYASITVDNTKVGGSANLTNFPVLVSGTYDGTGGEPDIRTTANGGDIQNTDATGGASGGLTVPADLAFYDDTSATTQYNHEIVSYNASTGAIVAYVKIPTLSYNSDTTFYMHYGDSSVTTSQESVASTWSEYEGVWHLEESGDGTAGEFKDSTGNNNAVGGGTTAQPTQASAIVGYGQSFDGGDYIDTGDITVLDGASAITITTWVWDSSFDLAKAYARKWSGGGGAAYTLGSSQAVGQDIEFGVVGANAAAVVKRAEGANLSTSTWEMVSGVWSGGDTFNVYKNGADTGALTDVTNTGTPDTIPNVNEHLTLGARWNNGTPDLFASASLDEVRISADAKTAGWLLTEYNTQSAPSTFYTMGSETLNHPITVDATSNSGVQAATSSITFSHTTGTLTNGILVVGVQSRDATTADHEVTGITYNSVALTKVRADELLGGANFRSELWYLVNPSSGANNVVVTFNGTADHATAGAITFSGVDQTSPVNVQNGANGTAQSSTLAVTTTVDNCVLIDSLYQSDTNDATYTDSLIYQLGPNSNGDRSGMQYERVGTAGSHGTGWTWVTAGQGYGHSLVALAPAGSAVTLAAPRRIIIVS